MDKENEGTGCLKFPNMYSLSHPSKILILGNSFGQNKQVRLYSFIGKTHNNNTLKLSQFSSPFTNLVQSNSPHT